MMKTIPIFTLSLLLSMALGVSSGVAKPKKPVKKKWDIEQKHVPSKVVTIQSQTGTWMNLDVSPDGKWIVFDLLGDLYLLPIVGGEAKQLTRGLAWDMQPRFSPDGKWVTFTSDRAGGDNIWIVQTDGKGAKAITKESYRLLSAPAWSPDGQFIVARKHFTSRRSIGAGEMWLYHRKGGGRGLQMTKRKTEQKDEGEPVFSPDGHYLYYSRDATPGPRFQYNKNAMEGIYSIERLNRKTGEIQVIAGGAGGAVRPTPSPDGKWLAFVRRDEGRSRLYVKNLTSGEETKLADNLERDLQETWAIHGVYPSMAWTPDNTSVVYWAQGKLWRINRSDRKVSPIPFKVKTTRRLLKPLRHQVKVAPNTFETKMLRWAHVSPKGKTVVFQTLGHLYIKPVAGGKARRLTRQNNHFEFYPSFSRDGKHLVYVSWNDDTLGHIRLIAAKGGKAKTLTRTPGHYIEPRLSPDKRTLIYRRVAGGWLTSPKWSMKQGLFAMDLASGREWKLAPSGWNARFSADGKDIFYLRRTGVLSHTLSRVNLTASERADLIQSKTMTQFAVSSDKRWLAFSEDGSIFLTPFPATGRLRKLSAKDKGVPVIQVSAGSGYNPHFSSASDRLMWQLGPTLFHISTASAIKAKNTKALAKIRHSHAMGLTVPHARPKGLLAITQLRMITMRGKEIIKNGTLLIEGNRIKAIGPTGTVTIPKEASIIEGRGLTAIPGLVDVHAHGAQAAYGITPQRNWKNYATLAFGVTTIHDPSNHSESVFAASELVKAGRVVGPRIFSTGTILYGASGHYRSDIQSLADAKRHVARQKAMGAVTVKSYNQPRRNQRQQVLAAARSLKMMVVPEGGALFQHNMNMIADGHTGIEHAIPLAHAYDDVLQFWAASDVGYTPTLNVAYGGLVGERYWYQEKPIYAHRRLLRFVPRKVIDAASRRPHKAPKHEWNYVDVARFAKRLIDAGGRVQLGAHGQREGLGAHWELWSLVQGGFTPWEALRAATLHGAYYIGLDKDLGSLEPGKLADIALIDGDPLKDIRRSEHIRYVIANGRLFDARTMRERYPHKGKSPTFFFHTGGFGGDKETQQQGECPICRH